MRQATLFRFVPDLHRITVDDEKALARYIDWHDGNSKDPVAPADLIRVRSIRAKLEGRERRRRERRRERRRHGR